MADDEGEDAQGGMSLLHYAALWGHIDTATALIESGAEMDAVDDNGNTPLHIAVDEGHISVIEFLVGKGAAQVANGEGKEPKDLSEDALVLTALDGTVNPDSPIKESPPHKKWELQAIEKAGLPSPLKGENEGAPLEADPAGGGEGQGGEVEIGEEEGGEAVSSPEASPSPETEALDHFRSPSADTKAMVEADVAREDMMMNVCALVERHAGSVEPYAVKDIAEAVSRTRYVDFGIWLEQSMEGAELSAEVNLP